MLNRAILLGRLTADPSLKYTNSGTAVTTFTLAIDRRVKNQQGEKETDFISIVVWSKLAELCAQYLVKGKQAAVEGRIQTRNYEKDGNKVYITEVVAENVQFLGGGNTSVNTDEVRGNPFAKESQWNDVPGKGIDISDSDLPFS